MDAAEAVILGNLLRVELSGLGLAPAQLQQVIDVLRSHGSEAVAALCSQSPESEPEPEPEPELEPEPQPELRSQGDTAEVGVPPPEHHRAAAAAEPRTDELPTIVLAPLNPRFVQAEPAQSDGARTAKLSPLEPDGPDCRAQLWQSEVELRGLQHEFAGIAASAITVQDDGEQLGRSEHTLAVRPAPFP